MATLNLRTVANGSVILSPTSTATDKTITLPATDGTMVVQDGTNTTTINNLAYTGTLTGSTGVINIGSGQVYKDASGNFGIGTATPANKLDVVGGSGRILVKSTSTAANADIRYTATNADWVVGVNSVSAAGEFTWYNVSASAERMRLDQSGNLGLGVTPSAWGSGWTGLNVNLTGFIAGNSSNEVVYVGSNTYNNATNWLYKLSGNNASLYQQAAGKHIFYTAPSGTAGAAISFTQAMTLDASGNLLVGATGVAGEGGLTIQPNVSAGAAAMIWNRASSTGSSFPIDFRNGGTTVGYITYTNSSTAYVTSSDYRLKENVQPMTGALATVAQLKPCTYTWKADGSAGQGFIAHELQAVVPDAVTGEKDAVDENGNPKYQGVDTSFLVATLTAAIKELTARLEVLENK